MGSHIWWLDHWKHLLVFVLNSPGTWPTGVGLWHVLERIPCLVYIFLGKVLYGKNQPGVYSWNLSFVFPLAPHALLSF